MRMRTIFILLGLYPCLGLASDNIYESYILQYNQYFGTSFKAVDASMDTIKQTYADQEKRVAAYFAAIRTCTPGTYKYINTQSMTTMYELAISPFMTAEIKGIENNECVISRTGFSITDNQPIPSTICKYSANSMALFTEQEAALANSSKSSFRSGSLTPIQSANTNECKEVKQQPK